MCELNTITKGRVAELHVASRLLAYGLEVYAPLVDNLGIDFLIRTDDGTVDEVQVKSVTNGRWFQVCTKEDPKTSACRRRFVLGVEGDGTTWVFPARVFYDEAIASVSRNKKGVYVYDLNLNVTRRGNQVSNATLLQEYREAFRLLGAHA
jgi:hypothetical protein